MKYIFSVIEKPFFALTDNIFRVLLYLFAIVDKSVIASLAYSG